MKKNGASKPAKGQASMARAIWLGIVGFIVTGIAAYVILYFLPPSDLRNYVDVSTHPGSGVSPNGPLMQKFRASLSHADIYVTLLSLFVAGLVLGRVSPPSAARKRVVRTGLITGLVISVINVAYVWAAAWEYATVEHTQAPAADSILIGVQIGLFIFWSVGAALGAYLGSLWRDRSAAGPKKATLSSSEAPAPQ